LIVLIVVVRLSWRPRLTGYLFGSALNVAIRWVASTRFSAVAVSVNEAAGSEDIGKKLYDTVTSRMPAISRSVTTDLSK